MKGEKMFFLPKYKTKLFCHSRFEKKKNEVLCMLYQIFAYL